MDAGSLDPADTRPHRLNSADYLGMRQYFLTISTGQRTRWFTDATIIAEVTLQFLRAAKQRSGFWFAQIRHQRLWQESYFDRTLRENESPADVISYIVGNPVRAGLVKGPEQYPFWGSQIYSREEILDFIAIESVRRV